MSANNNEKVDLKSTSVCVSYISSVSEKESGCCRIIINLWMSKTAILKSQTERGNTKIT